MSWTRCAVDKPTENINFDKQPKNLVKTTFFSFIHFFCHSRKISFLSIVFADNNIMHGTYTR